MLAARAGIPPKTRTKVKSKAATRGNIHLSQIKARKHGQCIENQVQPAALGAHARRAALKQPPAGHGRRLARGPLVSANRLFPKVLKAAARDGPDATGTRKGNATALHHAANLGDSQAPVLLPGQNFA